MIAGKDWLFVGNPKAASTTLRHAFIHDLQGETLYTQHIPYITASMVPAVRLCIVCVRNPWDRMVSGWAYNTHMGESFESWLTGSKWEVGIGLDFKRCPQTCWAWQCNKVLRFERLQEDWDRLCERQGWPRRDLRHKNPSERPDYRNVYTDRTREIVADRFAPDIEAWGYEF